ncbi:hypothetical protein VTN00DRAFT_6833 [Thermoascus crustaceus]|uniref:uncharacterized protein n=1 Tax=Thermoascus crustaceus TaxID=5088 RepID=UPI0037421EBE
MATPSFTVTDFLAGFSISYLSPVAQNDTAATIAITLVPALLQHHVLAQFPPPPPSADGDPSIKTIHSPVDGNVTIRYKSPPPGTCETVFPTTQKQYTGYIHLPPFTLAPIQQNYSVNTFFWFVESRTSPETAPLTIFMNGGPGSSSMVGMFQEIGPCEVVEIGKGATAYSTPDSHTATHTASVALADQQNIASAFLAQDGCQQRIQSCRTAVQAMDPEGEGNSNTTNAICADAQNYCTRNVIIGPYINSGLSAYDISQSSLNPFPPNASLECLNTAAVQSAIGASLNFTPSSPAVFAAGHLIPAYQPETLFTLFTRIILGTDLSSGEPVDLASFRTKGDPNATATNSAPPRASLTCYLRSVAETCYERQRGMLEAGEGVVINGVLYEREEDWKKPVVPDDDGIASPGEPEIASVTGSAGSSQTSKTMGTLATGVFTATSTPRMVGQR